MKARQVATGPGRPLRGRGTHRGMAVYVGASSAELCAHPEGPVAKLQFGVPGPELTGEDVAVRRSVGSVSAIFQARAEVVPTGDPQGPHRDPPCGLLH